jgi:hypothetical protein
LEGNGEGLQFGNFIELSGAGRGKRYGNYIKISNTNGYFHYGTYNELSGSGSGWQYGIYNVVNNTGDNYHFAVYNTLNGVGTHNQYGTYNKLFGAGSGSQVGTINEMDSTGNGSIFAECNLISSSATGTGNKYGIYSSIDSNAGGIHYALYASAPKSGSYAGYFNGDVNVKGKLKATRSGDSDMKAYVYGLVYYNGNIDSNRSSSGFSIHKSGTGTYEVTLSGVTNQNYIVSATAEIGGAGTAVIATTDYSSTTNGKFIIRIYQLSGALLNNSFHFVVYKK